MKRSIWLLWVVLVLLAFAFVSGGCGGGGGGDAGGDGGGDPSAPVGFENLDGEWVFDSGKPNTGSITVPPSSGYGGTYELRMAEGEATIRNVTVNGSKLKYDARYYLAWDVPAAGSYGDSLVSGRLGNDSNPEGLVTDLSATIVGTNKVLLASDTSGGLGEGFEKMELTLISATEAYLEIGGIGTGGPAAGGSYSATFYMKKK
ncbi:MAG: hypothetical protein LBQ58_03935 [Synergistaceae bacterium]|jgi:hypothetical protein|nr:hypothetical protein [Synergistaceae bacterium]